MIIKILVFCMHTRNGWQFLIVCFIMLLPMQYCTSVQQRGLWETSSKVNAMYDDRWINLKSVLMCRYWRFWRNLYVCLSEHMYFGLAGILWNPSHRCLKSTEHCYILCLLHQGKCAYAHQLCWCTSYGLCKILLKEVGYFAILQGKFWFT